MTIPRFLLISILGSAMPVLCATGEQTVYPTSTDASSYLSHYYGNEAIPRTGALGTTLASALYAVETSFAANGHRASDDAAIWSAAARATNSPELVASMAVSGWNYRHIVRHDWYKSGVPSNVQEDVISYVSAMNSVQSSVFLIPTPTRNAAPAPRATGAVALAAAAGAGLVLAGV